MKTIWQKINWGKINWGKVINLMAIVIVVIFALLLIASKFNFSGLQFLVVKSGSMAPTIKTGAFVAIKKSADYQINDIINFKNKTNLTETTTHRIINTETDEANQTFYITKGDANNTEDNQKITPDLINGKVVLDVPYLGYLVAFTQTGLGLILLIIIPATIIVYEEINTIRKEIKLRRGRKRVK